MIYYVPYIDIRRADDGLFVSTHPPAKHLCATHSPEAFIMYAFAASLFGSSEEEFMIMH